MCPNRVEELESRVEELEASVEGLTDELVECKVRLRELETAVDDELGVLPKADGSDDAEEDETDIRAPEPGESHDTAEATKAEGHDGDDNTEDSESDIIVA